MEIILNSSNNLWKSFLLNSNIKLPTWKDQKLNELFEIGNIEIISSILISITIFEANKLVLPHNPLKTDSINSVKKLSFFSLINSILSFSRVEYVNKNN